MTFIENLEKITRKRFSFGNELMDNELEDLIDKFKTYGEYLNQIVSNDVDILYDLSDQIWEYYLSKTQYDDFKKGDDYMLSKNREKNSTPGKIKVLQDINALKKARGLLQHVSSKNYRIMQGMRKFWEDVPFVPMKWQEENGNLKYQELIELYANEKECFTGSYYRNIALKAYDETVELYEKSEKFIFSDECSVQKDVFHSYWFLSALIADLETQSFELFERTEYYNPEKPSKSSIKNYLKFLKEEFNLKVSYNEKELIDNL